jgi:hypothetical protein
MHPLCSSVGPYHNFSYANSPNIAMWSLVKIEVHPLRAVISKLSGPAWIQRQYVGRR